MLEIAVRHKNDDAIMFILNHNPGTAGVDLGSRIFCDLLSREYVSHRIVLEGYGVRILVEQASASDR